MNPDTFNRLHSLRMENDEAGFAMQEMAPRFDRMKHRKENGTAPRAVVAYQLFQTPVTVSEHLASLLNLQPGARILEPSAGLGRLLDSVKPYDPSEVVAVEMAAQCAGELYRQERVGVTIKQRDFLTLTVADIGLFDAVIMNPPFHMRSDVKHCLHARQFLKPGGRLAAICMQGPHRTAALKPLASQWIELPASSFKEAGTHVGACLLTIEGS